MAEYDERIAKMHEDKTEGIRKSVALEQAVRIFAGLTAKERANHLEINQDIIRLAKYFEEYLKSE